VRRWAHIWATFTTFLCVAFAFNVPSAFPEGVKVIDFFAVLPIEANDYGATD